MVEIKNLKKASKRILKAVKGKERIIIYGDADLDGTTSVIVLREAIKNLGGKVDCVYFPDREAEGHGLTSKALSLLEKRAPALLITVDCGIANVKEVAEAKKLGFEIVIVDHHEALDKLPKAKVIVDPKQKTDKYPFKGLAAAGVVFKLVEEMFSHNIPKSLQQNFLELVALATIADMMPRAADNLLYIEKGLSTLKDSFRPGIKVFFSTKELKDLDFTEKVYKIISLLNIRDVKDGEPASFRLLTCSSAVEARKIVGDLLKQDIIRKEKVEEMIFEIEGRLQGKPEPIVFEGDSEFDLVLLSRVASLIVKEYGKPAFLYKKLAKESQGTIRAPSGVDVVLLMKKCSKLLLTYGGHAQAAGFRIKNENLEEFKKCLIKNL